MYSLQNSLTVREKTERQWEKGTQGRKEHTPQTDRQRESVCVCVRKKRRDIECVERSEREFRYLRLQ